MLYLYWYIPEYVHVTHTVYQIKYEHLPNYLIPDGIVKNQGHSYDLIWTRNFAVGMIIENDARKLETVKRR